LKHTENSTTKYRVLISLLSIIFLLLTFYGALYSTKLFFPNEQYKSKLNTLFEKQLIETQVTKRTPTGWLAGSADECLSLGVGSQRPKSFGGTFLEEYSTQVGTYDPCGGLALSTGFLTGSYETVGYARYWHGHAVVTQWMVLAIGLPNLKNLIWGFNIILIFYLAYILSRRQEKNESVLMGIALIGPYFMLTDQAELHNVITHQYVSVVLLLTIIFFVRNFKNSTMFQIRMGAILGSVYCFLLYGLSPQLLPVAMLSWAGIFLISNQFSIHFVLKKVGLFLFSWVFGYLSTFVAKWVIVALMTNYPIWNDVKNQLIYRSSQNSDNLSNGVGIHLQFAKDLPSFVQSWIANFSSFLIHILDPRYSSLILIYLLAAICIVVFLFLIYLFKTRWFVDWPLPRDLLCLNSMSLLFLLLWYAVLAQHSYDHATYTFRSIPIWIGGLMTSSLILFKRPNLKS